ncbi:MAG: glycosyltransferase family 4 protein [Syntrophothermus sp.]|nr:glycosyltransferase family 4 protein [Ignavibacteriaceae bacterium]
MKNTICMITQSRYPLDPRVRRQAEALEKEGYEVDILCLPSIDDLPVEKFGNITAYRVLKNPKKKEKMHNYLFLTFIFFVKSYLLLQKLYKERNYKVIQIHNMPEFHVFTALPQKRKKVPIVLDIHDLTTELFEEKWPKLSPLTRIVTNFAEKISTKFANKVITVTDGCKEILISRGVPEEKITLILNTADVETFKFNYDRDFNKIEESAKLLYHGTVAYRFGIHIAIEALSQLNRVIPNSRLYVYGKYDPSYRAYLNTLINKLELVDSVYLNYSRPWEEIIEIMNNSDIEIVPYLGTKYMHLSLSTKLFECAAAGLPVVSTKLNTIRKTFKGNSIKYFKDRDPKNLAEKITELCLNPEERKTQTLNAYRELKDISGDIMSSRYIELMSSLIKTSSEEENHQRRNPLEAIS